MITAETQRTQRKMFSLLLRRQEGKPLRLGLILNFNVTMMRDGIKRIVHEFCRIEKDAIFAFPRLRGKQKLVLAFFAPLR
jgi:hypothetical protein